MKNNLNKYNKPSISPSHKQIKSHKSIMKEYSTKLQLIPMKKLINNLKKRKDMKWLQE